MKKLFTLIAMMCMLAFSSQAGYYIVGNDPFGGWNPGDGPEMTQNADGTYSLTATINGSVWFVFASGLDSDWSVFNANYRYGPAGGVDETVEPNVWTTTQLQGNGDGAYKFEGSGGEYVFTFNPFIKKFKIEGYVVPWEPESFTVAGSPATIFGTEWDENNVDNDMTDLGNGIYQLKKFNCELAGGSNIEFKVVGNHDWGHCWPDQNYVCPVEESGLYDVTINFDYNTKLPSIELVQSGTIDVRTGELYVLGEVNGNGWDPSNGVKMDTEDENVFTAKIVTAGENIDENDGNGYSFFSFTTKLGANSDDWGSIGAYRLGATDDGFPLTDDMLGMEIDLGGFGSTNSFKVPAGEYELCVNLDAQKMIINKVVQEVTPIPEISYEVTDDAVIITATGMGEVCLFVNQEMVENPYTIARGEEDVTVSVAATAQEEGKLASSTMMDIVIPAKVVEPTTGYKIEKLWEINDLSFLSTADVRQGFGMNGKFYINNKADLKIVVVDENGIANTEYEGGANCGITRDEAGNIVVSNAAFPGAWTEATIKVINPETSVVKEYAVPEECGLLGRCDFIGFAKGNLMEDGALYLTGGNTGTDPFTNGVAILTITGGEVNVDECYTAACDGITGQTSTVINYFKNLNEEDVLIYAYRSGNPSKLTFDGDNLVAAPIVLPGKGHANGIFPFIWEGKEYYIYPIMPDYQNGFAIAEDGAEEALVEVPSTVAANANAFQADWFNAEVDKDGVTIYQYYPGGNIAVYRLTNNTGGIDEIINPEGKTVAGVRYYNIMGQEMKEANGLTIVVTTYTDGSHNAVKVIK